MGGSSSFSGGFNFNLKQTKDIINNSLEQAKQEMEELKKQTMAKDHVEIEPVEVVDTVTPCPVIMQRYIIYCVSDDTEIITGINSLLATADIQIIGIDKSATVSEDSKMELGQQIINTDAVLIFLTENAIPDDWCTDIINICESVQKPIHGVYQNAQPSNIPVVIIDKKIPCLDLDTWLAQKRN